MAIDEDYISRLRAAAKALAERTLEYVGPEDDPQLECDSDMRRLAQEVLDCING